MKTAALFAVTARKFEDRRREKYIRVNNRQTGLISD